MKRLLLSITIAMLAVPIFAQNSSQISVEGKLLISSAKIYHPNSTHWQEEPLANGSIIKVRDAATKQVISTENFVYQNNQVIIDLQESQSRITLQTPAAYFGNLTSALDDIQTDVKIGTVILTAYDQQGKRIGDFAQSNVAMVIRSAMRGEQLAADIVAIIYSSGKFSYKDSNNLMGIDKILDLRLTKGWNNIVHQANADDNGVLMSILTDVTPGEQVEWMVMSIEPEPSNDSEPCL